MNHRLELEAFVQGKRSGKLDDLSLEKLSGFTVPCHDAPVEGEVRLIRQAMFVMRAEQPSPLRLGS